MAALCRPPSACLAMGLEAEAALAAIMQGAVQGGASRQVAAAIAVALWRVAVAGSAAVVDAGVVDVKERKERKPLLTPPLQEGSWRVHQVGERAHGEPAKFKMSRFPGLPLGGEAKPKVLVVLQQTESADGPLADVQVGGVKGKDKCKAKVQMRVGVSGDAAGAPVLATSLVAGVEPEYAGLVEHVARGMVVDSSVVGNKRARSGSEETTAVSSLDVVLPSGALEGLRVLRTEQGGEKAVADVMAFAAARRAVRPSAPLLPEAELALAVALAESEPPAGDLVQAVIKRMALDTDGKTAVEAFHAWVA